MNKWNVHNIPYSYIDNIGIPKHKKNTYDFLVQVRDFLLPLSWKVFRRKEERGTIFLWRLFYGTCRNASASSESQPSSSDTKTQPTDFSQISAHTSGAWCHPSPGPNSYLGFLFWHLWMTPPPHAREHLRSCCTQLTHALSERFSA